MPRMILSLAPASALLSGSVLEPRPGYRPPPPARATARTGLASAGEPSGAAAEPADRYRDILARILSGLLCP